MAGLLWYRSYMDSLANKSGYYPDIHAGHADRVAELTLDAPYLVRETPAGCNQLELMELVGGTVAWNQQLKEMNSTNFIASSSFATASFSNGVATVTSSIQYGGLINAPGNRPAIPNGHKVLCRVDVKLSSAVSNAIKAYWNEQTGTVVTAEASTNWQTLSKIITWDSSKNSVARVNDYRSSDWDSYQVRNSQLFDLTQMFGSTIADYVYSLEQNVAGSGVEWLKAYGFFTEDYYAYSAPALEHVKTTAHITKDADDNVLGTYPFDSSLLLRGVPKLENGALIYDGDTYEPDGTVTRYFDIRAYQAGDESLADAITDGTDTVYKLGAPTTESADPYTAMQDVEEGGTEEFVTGNNVPVGNVSIYRRA